MYQKITMRISHSTVITAFTRNPKEVFATGFGAVRTRPMHVEEKSLQNCGWKSRKEDVT
jgi:hypothetical protein